MSTRRPRPKPTPRDEGREQRIASNAIVDAYGPEEQAMGWYYYLQDRIAFPFTAVCDAARQISPLRIGDEVEALDMADEDECEGEMFVLIRWGHRASDTLAVPLAQLDVGENADEATNEAVADWRYWTARGYQF
jgi:Calcium binding